MAANINVINLLNGKGTYTIASGSQANESIITVIMNTGQRMITEPLIIFKYSNGLYADIPNSINIINLEHIEITVQNSSYNETVNVYLYDGLSDTYYYQGIQVIQGRLETFEYIPQTDGYFRISKSITQPYKLKIKPLSGYIFDKFEVAYYDSETGLAEFEMYEESDMQVSKEGDYYSIQLDNGNRVHKVYLNEDPLNPPDITEEYNLIINIVGEGTINVGNGMYREGIRLSLLPTPKPGWRFKEWSGDLISTVKNENIIMNSDKTITLIFEKIVEVNYVGNGSIEFDPPLDNYQPGDTLNMIIKPDPGWKIDNVSIIDPND